MSEEEAEPIHCAICGDEEEEEDLYSCDACQNRVCDDCYNYNMNECNDCGTVTCSDCRETLDRDATHFCESCHKDVCYDCYGSDNTCKGCQWDELGVHVQNFLNKQQRIVNYRGFMDFLKEGHDPDELLPDEDEDEDEEEEIEDLENYLQGELEGFRRCKSSPPENSNPVEGKVMWIES